MYVIPIIRYFLGLFVINRTFVFLPNTEARDQIYDHTSSNVTISDPNPYGSHDLVGVVVAITGGQAAEICGSRQHGWVAMVCLILGTSVTHMECTPTN